MQYEQRDHIGLYDYSFYDPMAKLYLVYRSRHPYSVEIGERQTVFAGVEDVMVHVPHDAIYIGTSIIPKGVVVPKQAPPPPRGWSDSYPHEPIAKGFVNWIVNVLNPFSG